MNARFASFIGATLLAASCKTVQPSSLHSSQDVTDGLHVNVPSRNRLAWSVRMGMDLRDAAGAGATIETIMPAEFASVIGLKQGDIILALNSEVITTSAEFETVAQTIITKGWNGVWAFRITRGGIEQTVQPLATYECDPFQLVGCGPLDGP